MIKRTKYLYRLLITTTRKGFVFFGVYFTSSLSSRMRGTLTWYVLILLRAPNAVEVQVASFSDLAVLTVVKKQILNPSSHLRVGKAKES